MARLQFNLRHVLVAIVLIAVGLLFMRLAMRWHGVAVALLIVAMGAAILGFSSVLLYGFLRAVGLVFDLDSRASDEAKVVSMGVKSNSAD